MSRDAGNTSSITKRPSFLIRLSHQMQFASHLSS
jgi:hypothetical protein